MFRSVPAAIVTLLPSGLALLISTRLIGAMGASGLKISSITQILLIILLLGAGTDYGLFLVFRVREELREGHDPHEAVRRSVIRVGESITASAATVIIALLTLLIASFGLYHDLGVPLAVGVAVMLLIGLTLPRSRSSARVWPRRSRRPSEGSGGGARRSAGRRASGYHSSGFGGATNAPTGSDAAAGNAELATHFPQSSSNPANLVFAYSRSLWSDPGAITTAQSSLRDSGKFSALAGPLNPNGTGLTPSELGRLYAGLGPPQRLPVTEPALLRSRLPETIYNPYRASAVYLSADGRTMQFEASLTAGPQDSTAAMNVTPQIRTAVSDAARASGAADSGVAGEAAAVYDISTTANHDLLVIIPVAILAIGMLLALVLRSLVAPLYLIVSVLFSYLAALGVATLVFIDIAGEGGIIFILPFLMFVFLLALGEDYNILVMTRIREEAARMPLREAVVRAVGRTGPTVTSAGIILGGTFAVFGIVGGGGSRAASCARSASGWRPGS